MERDWNVTKVTVEVVVEHQFNGKEVAANLVRSLLNPYLYMAVKSVDVTHATTLHEANRNG